MQLIKLSTLVAFTIFLLIVINLESPEVEGRPPRRRKLRGKENSARFIFLQNSKRKDYYNNTNGQAEIVKSSYWDVAYELGDKISLQCISVNSNIFWMKDGQEYIGHQFSRIKESLVDRSMVKSKLDDQSRQLDAATFFVSSKLIIDPARQIDAGTYECVANNQISSDKRSFKVDF